MSVSAPQSQFQFLVSVNGTSPSPEDALFQEVSGLQVEMGRAPLSEGDDYRFKQSLKGLDAPKNLTLRRCIMNEKSDLVKWCKASLEGSFDQPITVHDLTIQLQNEKADLVAKWTVSNAFPVNWAVKSFGAMADELTIQSIEVSHQGIKRVM